MNKIVLQSLLPQVFLNEEIKSEIWSKTVWFELGNSYLIQANSGTGKSSLCSYLYGYRDDYTGEIFFDGNNIKNITSSQWDEIHRTKISLLFQELHLFGELTALENIRLKNNLTNFKSETQINQMFHLLGISNKKDVKIANMSWGQQQRVAIIRCMCQPFDFLILDEPISHLDDENAQIIAHMVHKELLDRDAALITTSIGKHLPMSYTKIYSL